MIKTIKSSLNLKKRTLKNLEFVFTIAVNYIINKCNSLKKSYKKQF